MLQMGMGIFLGITSGFMSWRAKQWIESIIESFGHRSALIRMMGEEEKDAGQTIEHMKKLPIDDS